MFDEILKIANKFIPDQDAARKLAVELEKESTKQMSMKSDIIQAEERNGTGKWRVRLMYMCMFMVFSQWLMFTVLPWLEVVLELEMIIPQVEPMNEELWSFLKIGVGGYIGSRGVEKSIAHFKGN